MSKNQNETEAAAPKRERTLSELFAQWTDEPGSEAGAGGDETTVGKAAVEKAGKESASGTAAEAENDAFENGISGNGVPGNGIVGYGAARDDVPAVPPIPAVPAVPAEEAETRVIPAIRFDDGDSPATSPAPVAPSVPTPRTPSAEQTQASSTHRPRIHVPAAFLAPEVSPGYTPPMAGDPAAAPDATPDAAPKPAGRRRRAPADPVDSAATTAATALNGDRRGGEKQPAAPARTPIPVPPEFFDTPSSAAAAGTSTEPAADPEAETRAEAKTAIAITTVEAEPGETTPAEKPATKPDGGGFNGPPRWQESVPFDETGVLMRPESLRAKAMQDETELISAIKVDDDGSEAAQSQRPGFWTGAWPRRAMVALIMVLQAVLSLRNNNSPFVDESLYLYSGHLELGHMLYGTATGIDFWSYFSGAPVLYPPLGALADQLGGIFAARLLSLAFMLGTTGLLYLVTRRLFGTRAGLCAAALFSCTEATIFLGGLATYDAPALFLLALSTWIVVRFAAGRYPLYLLAIFPAALAVGTKYVSLLFVPTILVLALVAAAPYSRRWALVRPVALTLGTACVLYAGYRLAGTSAAAGISATTTSRAHGTDTITLVLKQAAQYSGVVFVIALIGAVFVIRLPQRHAHPAVAQALWQRCVLVALLAGTALLAPLYQAHLHTAVSLQKHVGFGMFFAAPLAGYGLVRIVGPHFHRLQLGIGILVLTFAFGMGQSLTMFHSWPNTYGAVAELVKYQKPGAHYLFADGPNVIYLLRGDRYAEPSQFTDAFSFGWFDEQGKYITGETAYADAIQAGYFQVVTYDFSANPPIEQAIAQDLYNSPIYRLAAKIPSPTSGGPGWSYVWVRK